MSKYSLSIERLLSLLPVSLRKANNVSLASCLLNPVSYLHMMFTLYREKKEYRLAHNGQVFSLTKVICDYCGNDGCYITDGTYIEEVFLPTNAEGELIHHQVSFPTDGSVSPQVWVPSGGMSQIQQADFIVHLPSSLFGNIDEAGLRSLIDEYKLAGKQYTIVYDDVDIEHYEYAWTNDVCALEPEPVVEVYNYEWTNLICVLEESYSYRWTNLVCVRDYDYTFAWSNAICAKKYTDDRYTSSWSNAVCVKVSEEPYKYGWSNTVCVKVVEEVEVYKYEWSNSICRQISEDKEKEPDRE